MTQTLTLNKRSVVWSRQAVDWFPQEEKKEKKMDSETNLSDRISVSKEIKNTKGD